MISNFDWLIIWLNAKATQNYYLGGFWFFELPQKLDANLWGAF
ncbi:hypothetical protein AO369_0313 [Moraxella catarrhalis]|nr:hypothetical protein AO369_0313 [Moraxella catarrhalis]